MTIGFLGAGNMAEAIISGVVRAGMVKAAAICACDKVPQRLRELARRYRGLQTTEDVAIVMAKCEIVVLAVKPQDMGTLLASIAPLVTGKHLFISIAAGKTLSGLQALLGAKARLVRVMPNLGLRVGAGMSVYCRGAKARVADGRRVKAIMETAGVVIELNETHFDAVTALSGSGPAFFAMLMQAMVAGAVAQGLPAESALLLALQTMLGTAQTLLQTGEAPADFIKAVTSPGGTTAAGLAVLEKSAVQRTLARTIAAAAKRSATLSKA